MARRSLARSSASVLAALIVLSGTLMLPIAAPAQRAEVIRFGAPVPITGPLAPEAIKQQQGYD